MTEQIAVPRDIECEIFIGKAGLKGLWETVDGRLRVMRRPDGGVQFNLTQDRDILRGTKELKRASVLLSPDDVLELCAQLLGTETEQQHVEKDKPSSDTKVVRYKVVLAKD